MEMETSISVRWSSSPSSSYPENTGRNRSGVRGPRNRDTHGEDHVDTQHLAPIATRSDLLDDIHSLRRADVISYMEIRFRVACSAQALAASQQTCGRCRAPASVIPRYDSSCRADGILFSWNLAAVITTSPRSYCTPGDDNVSDAPIISIIDDDESVRSSLRSLVRSLGL